MWKQHLYYPVVALLAGWLLACGTLPGRAPGDHAPAPRYRIVGYVRDVPGQDLRRIDARRLTHINYAFANLVGDTLVLEGRNDPASFARLNALRAQNPELQILLSVGGWGWSDYFSDAALTDSARARFARSAVRMLTTYALDGIDIDWEYPGLPGEGNVYRPEDRENFTLLLKALREHLDAQGARDGHRYLLTIAGGASAAYVAHTDLGAAQQYLDFVNIMTYDFAGSWSDSTGHHTNLFPSAAAGAPAVDAASGVARYIAAGVPPEKIVLGVAFYGRWWAGVQPEGNGLFQPASDTTGAFSYDTLRRAYIDRNGYVRHWDEAARAPYLWHPEAGVFITYDDEASLRHKARYVKQRGLGGVMYWEHSHDPSGRLLNTLYEALR